jgi:hypothetical protein
MLKTPMIPIKMGMLPALILAAASLAPGQRVRTADNPLSAMAAATPVNISRSGTESGFPVVGVDANNAAYAIWLEYLGKRTFTFATNKSGSWSTPVAFEQVVYDAEEAGFPDMAVSAGGVCHVSWQDGRNVSYDIFHISYNNGFGATTNVSDANEGGSAYSGIAVNPVDNAVYVVWMDGTGRELGWDITMRARTASGSWSGMAVLPVGQGYMPKVAFDASGTAHLTWTTRGWNTSAVWYSKNATPQNASSWTQPVMVEADTGQDWCYPRIDADKAGNAYVIWLGKAQGADAIVFRKIGASGAMSEKSIASTPGATAAEGVVAVNKSTGVAYVAWTQSGEILANSYGTGWSGPQNMTNNAANDMQPSLALDASGNIHLVYAEIVGGAWDVMYLGSAGGTTPPPVVKPKPPLGLTLGTALNSAQTLKSNALAWTSNPANAGISLKSTKIYRKSGGQTEFALMATVSGSVFTYLDADLPLAQKYTYAVSFVSSDDQEGELSAPSAEITVFQPLGPICKTVINSALFRKEKINVLTWRKNPLNDAVTVLQYNIYRKLTTESDSKYQKIASVGAGVFEYLDRKLSATDVFVYYITTVDTGNNESQPSAAAREAS